MKYIIMFLIVLVLAIADFLTGYIKAKCKNRVSSKALRIGGLHKITELVIMATAIGLTVGLDMLGKYYDNQQLTNIAGMFTAFSIFGYISVMEIVSVLENFAEIVPQAKWARKILKRMKNYEGDEKNDI